MDPILEQKTRELYAKLTKARAAGVEISPEEIETWMRRETNGKFGLSEAQAYVQSLGDFSGENVAKTLGQGASYNFQDEAMGKLQGPEAEAGERLRDKAFTGRHPYAAAAMKFAGGLIGPLVAALAAPEAAGVGGAGALAHSMLTGAAVGGAATAGASEAPDLDSRMTAAVPGVATGLLMGGVAHGAARGLAQRVTGLDKSTIRDAGRMMPEGLQQAQQRSEMLAPDTFLPASTSEEATQAATGIGANPRAAMTAIQRVTKQIQDLKDAKADVSAAYEQTDKSTGPMLVDQDLRDILHSVGEDYMGKTVGFRHLQKLRTFYAEKNPTHSQDKHLYGEFNKRLTDWLAPRVPGLSEIDSRWKFLSEHQGYAEKLLDVVTKSNTTHGKNALYGNQSVSVGGQLSTNLKAMTGKAVDAVSNIGRPSAAARADAIGRLLVTPADASRTAALAGARADALQGPGSEPIANTVAPAGGADAILELLRALSGSQVPSQLQQQQGGAQ